ncbi:MAG: Coenzyme F420 hydrogenase/dehydrogenase, beta subunit C-terminal domain [Sarcina sp.]
MIEIKDKKDCCGCYGCENICPKNCISMNNDNEGFWYPKVNNLKCIDCGLCEKVCPMISSISKRLKIKYLAIKNREESTRLESSSGGVFSLLSDEIIKDDGYVIGSCYNENLEIEYNIAKVREEVATFRGSKYSQSRLNNIYLKVKKLLNNDQQVMFTGTPCHVAGLKHFLGKEYEHLLLVDIACHGVPSPKVFKKYIFNLNEEQKSEVITFSFRNKDESWKNYNIKYKFKNGKEVNYKANKDIYMQGFLKDLYLRPSCYNCKFKKPYTESDLTLADYWGVQNIHPEFDDDKGVSLVLVNSDKGQAFIDNISDKIDMIETDGEFAIKNNPCIVKPVNYNPKREKFFEDFDKMDLIKNIEDKTKISFIVRCKTLPVRVLSKIKRTLLK